MDKNINALLEVDWISLILTIFIIMSAVIAIVTIIGKFSEVIGKPVKWVREKRKDHELLQATTELAKKTAENLSKLQDKHVEDEQEFRNNLNNYMQESRADRKALHDEMSKFTENRINDRKQSIEIQKELKDSIKGLVDGQKDRDAKIENLTSLFINKEIDDMRWEILNFCSALTSGRKYNKESFDHVIQIHEKYEQILEENNMENGRVTASMEVIMDVYKEKLRTGF